MEKGQKSDRWYEKEFLRIRKADGGNAALAFFDQMPPEVRKRLRDPLLGRELLRRALKEKGKESRVLRKGEHDDD